jgi:hypothetical protein
LETPVRARLAAFTALLAATVAVPAIALAGSSPAEATWGTSEDGNCLDLGEGRVNVPGNAQTTTVTAPAGKLIQGYCVKAAGAKGTNGAPYYVWVATPVAALVLRHPDGGNLTHYSLYLIDEPGDATPTPTPTPTPETPEETEEPEDEFPTNPENAAPFDWNWEYAEPTCDAVTVDYPSNLPSGQANDVNIRLETDQGQVTLNYHNNEGTWSGTTGFTYSQHPNWPAGVTSYSVTWVQVGGTNYHWQGDVSCTLGSDGDPSTLDVPLAVTEVAGFRTGAVTVKRGSTVASDSVEVEQVGLQALTLQRYSTAARSGIAGRLAGTWTTVKTVPTSERGTARVTFPTLTKRGTYQFRLSVAGTECLTGDTTGTLTVRVR